MNEERKWGLTRSAPDSNIERAIKDAEHKVKELQQLQNLAERHGFILTKTPAIQVMSV